MGQKWFRNRDEATQGKLFVTSVFYTLQGEGPYQGLPAIFVRLAKCNLNCSFCDTFFDDGDWLSFEEIWEKITEVVAQYHNISWDDVSDIDVNLSAYQQVLKIINRTVLVITGGEPLLQENLGNFLLEVEGLFANTQIESNGIVSQELPESTTLVISPKCSEKTGRYLTPNQSNLERVNALKFVISADPESPYHTIPDWALDLADEIPIYISPMNIYNDEPRKSKQLRMETNMTSLKQRSEIDEVISFWEPDLLNMEENQKNHEYAAKYALKHGLRLNLQIHLYASLA